jgi:hypothetical protein
VLDATKSGLRLKPEKVREHKRTWTKTRGPEWKERVEDKKKDEKIREDNRSFMKRSNAMGRFVMDEITRLAEKKANEELKAM